RPPPTSSLFPYTTLFRSGVLGELFLAVDVRERRGHGLFRKDELQGRLRKGHSLSLIDPTQIRRLLSGPLDPCRVLRLEIAVRRRSEEHTSELQSRGHLVC